MFTNTGKTGRGRLAASVLVAAALVSLGSRAGGGANAASFATGTFGKSTIGAKNTWASPNYTFTSKYTLDQAGTVQKLTAYVFGTGTSGAQVLRAVIYGDNAGDPGALKAVSQEVTLAYNSPRGWVDFALANPVSLPAGDYWLGFQSGPSTGDALTYFGYDNVWNGRQRYDDYADGPANPFGTNSAKERQIAVYATYVPAVTDAPVAPTPPSGLAVTNQTATSLTLAWKATAGAAGYGIYINGSSAGTTQGTSYAFSNLTCGTSYTLAVDAYDAAGNRSTQSSVVSATSPCPDGAAPSVPSGLAVTAQAATGITISWNPSTDNVGVAGYGLYVNGTNVNGTPNTSYAFSGLSCGTSYKLAVDAYDAAGNRSAQTSLVASTSGCPAGSAPSAPSGLAQTAQTASSITISWNASSGAVGYGVYRNGASVGSTQSTSYAVSGLGCGTSYTLAVDAYDASGTRSAKSSVQAATTACPTTSIGQSLPAQLPPSTGTAFYVAPGGADANPGTLAAPWATIQHAMDTLGPGQIAYVRAGTYAEGGSQSSVWWEKSGTASAPITISGYPGETQQVVLRMRVKMDGAYLRLANLVIDRNYHFSNFDNANTGDVNVWLAGDHQVVERTEIRNGNMSGIFTTGTNDQMLDNYIHDNGNHAGLDHGIYLGGTGQLVAGNVIDRNKAFGLQYWPSCNSCIVTENTFVHNGSSGVLVAGPSNNAKVVGNVSAYNADDGIHVYALTGTGNVADGNLTYGNGSGDYCLAGCGGGLAVSNAITSNPQFVADNADYHLQSASPAVDKAAASFAFLRDRDGVARPIGMGPDIGAYER